MQVKSASNLADALAVMVKASSINSMDAAGITAFMQQSSGDDDEAAVYESHSDETGKKSKPKSSRSLTSPLRVPPLALDLELQIETLIGRHAQV